MRLDRRKYRGVDIRESQQDDRRSVLSARVDSIDDYGVDIHQLADEEDVRESPEERAYEASSVSELTHSTVRVAVEEPEAPEDPAAREVVPTIRGLIVSDGSTSVFFALIAVVTIFTTIPVVTLVPQSAFVLSSILARSLEVIAAGLALTNFRVLSSQKKRLLAKSLMLSIGNHSSSRLDDPRDHHSGVREGVEVDSQPIQSTRRSTRRSMYSSF